MKNYNYLQTFKVESPVKMETSHGVIDSEKSATLEITVGVSTKDEYGFFEIYDLESGGERFYGEGGLWFKGRELVDYDGVFDISNHILEKLKEWGFDVSEF